MSVKLTLCLLLAVVAFVHSAPLNKGKIKFKVSGRNLPDKDDGPGTTDGYFEIFQSEDGGRTRKKVGKGKSTTVSNNLNPDWGDVFEFDFDRTKNQLWYFKLWDHDTMMKDDKVGRVWVTVTDYVDKGQLTNANLDKGGYIIIKSVDVIPPPYPHTPIGQIPLPPGTPSTQTLRFKVSASGLQTKDDVGFIPGKSDPYVIITSANGVTGKETKLGRSATVSGTSSPSWGDVFTFPWDSNKDQRLHFKLFDDDHLREDDKLGSGWVEMNDYVAHGQTYTLNLPKGASMTITRA